MKPLSHEGGEAAKRLAEANLAFAPAPGEQAAAWSRLRRALPDQRAVGDDGPRVGGRLWFATARLRGRLRSRMGLGIGAGLGAAAAVAVMLWLFVAPRPRGDAPGATSDATARARDPGVGSGGSETSRAGPSVAPPIAAAQAPRALPMGRSLVTAGVRVRLAPRSAATVLPASGDGARVVTLERGALDLEVDGAPPAAAPAGARRPAAPVEVEVASYRMRSEGGRFRVSTQDGRVALVVHSGKLVVWSSRRVVAQVIAGERWTNRPSAVAATTPAISGAPPAPAESADCTQLTRSGAIDQALACFSDESRQPGLVGELALIEQARIRRDVKGDLVGAERALAEHRRRFPHGALADEAAAARIELLLRLGRAGEALSESEQLPGSDGIFWRAVSLNKLGRRDEAARAFDAYLRRADGKHRNEATRMRKELAP